MQSRELGASAIYQHRLHLDENWLKAGKISTHQAKQVSFFLWREGEFLDLVNVSVIQH